MLQVLILLAGLLIGTGVANYLYDKKVAKLYKNQVDLLNKAHDESFTQGWRAGEAHGRRQEAIDRVMRNNPDPQ